jgi:hypothetical protein
MRKISAHYLALVALPLYMACAASDEGEPPENTAGTSSAAGTSSTAGTTGTAGTLGAGGTTGTSGATGTSGSGTAGSVTGTAGSVGTAGSTGTAGSGTGGTGSGGSCVPPTNMMPSISTFEMNVSNQLSAGTDVWSASPAGNVATAMDGALKVLQTGTGSWGSVSTLLNKSATPICFNVEGKYQGIKFKISSATNTTMKFIVVTPETKADSSHFGKVLTLTATPTDVSVTFAELTSTFGVGSTLVGYKPAQHLIGVGFGVMMEKEPMDIVLDDVMFY